MAELLIRPSLNDHQAIADLLAQGALPGRRPISRLVVSAQDAARRPQFSELAAESGTPLWIDPMTTLLQAETDKADPWVEKVPFGRSDPLPSDQLANPFLLDALVAEVLEFQVDQGATAVVPPYFYAQHPDSPEFAATIAAIGRTARRMRSEGVALPLVPVLCAQLQGFAHRAGWQQALDRFSAAAIDVGPQALGLYFSPVGTGDERYRKLLDLLVAARHLRSAGTPVVAWRQGAYGSALVAAGIDGYECGMGIGESADVRGMMNARKPRERSGSPFSAQGIFIPGLGRSLPPKVARLLFADRRLKGRLICDSVRCCPHGTESMLSSKGRGHAVRARARGLEELEEIPHGSWRLHHIAKSAASAFVTASKANELLARSDLPNRIRTEGYAALEQVAEFLRAQGPQGARDSA
jgi:hypothetical protein